MRVCVLGLLLAGALLSSSAARSGETITTAYDAKGRLVSVARTGTINNGFAANYCYDKADNRAQVTVSSGACTAAGAGSNFAIADASGTEGGSVVFTVTRYGETSAAQSVNYATAGDTAVSGTDFTASSGTLNFAAEEFSKTITVATLQDFAFEGSERFFVNLSGASSGATIGVAQGIGTIVDDEPPVPPSFTVTDSSVTEGGVHQFVITKSGSAPGNISINYATADGTATSGSDYASASGTLTFLPSDNGKVVTVNTIDDAVVESTETMTLNLSGVTNGATIMDGVGIGTITDNDVPPPPPGILIADSSGTEGQSIIFTVTRSDTTTAVSVNYATASDTAVSPNDFTAISGTLSFAIGQGSKTITVVTKQNTIFEDTETFFVNLSNATGGATIGDAQGVGTIYDDDPNPCPTCRPSAPSAPATTSDVPPPADPPGGGL